jgi:spermidine synthase
VDGTRRVGLIGLGAGTLATFGRPGDVFRFYEIDPAIVQVARQHFQYLQRTAATVEIALGDARLTLEAERRRGEPGNFHVLVLDAFSGDAIPVHLLTREAMALYLDHLRPDGVIAVHISNRHLDLRPVVEGLAREHHLHFATIEDTGGDDRWWIYDTTWVLLSRDPARLAVDDIRRVTQAPPDESARFVHWTDDHASLFEVLKW